MPWRKWPTILNIITGKNDTGSNAADEMTRIQAPRSSVQLDCMSLRRQFLIPAFALVALTAPLFSAFCQTNATFPENRYLLVVETSRSMQRRSDGILGAVQQVLNSGAGGQRSEEHTSELQSHSF